MSANRADLAQIRTFPQLVKFLRDELDWPISSENFEDLLFDYSPEELGIDSKNAAKIQEIKRLRPLTVNQPWGVFFVKFEPKRLPVVALKRILNSVVLKKRASANHSERAAWDAEDLLFISNYGSGDARQITFAHFSQDPEKPGLPTLKVLGWDNLDTPLHIDHVADELIEHLAWPTDEDDVEGWREGWRSAFTLRHREVITTSKELAVRLADLARAIRERIRTALAIETESGPLTKLMTAFQKALVNDLDADGFADMYAQTIAYGLLSARIAYPKGTSADDLVGHMPVTNPFLKELMETFLHAGDRRGKEEGGPGIDFDELGLYEVVGLLDDANMEAVVLDFGDKNPEEDPIIHFYELFLGKYDKKQKVSRGVFYTPRPVASFIVRAVNEILQTEFGLEDGFADTTTWGAMARTIEGLVIPTGTPSDQPFVQVLDPATGTGTFLVEVIDLIHETMIAKWKAQSHNDMKIAALWNEYVPKHLLPRLHGYELLMAPYAIAHLKIGLKLYETGYNFESDERVRLYLTNALEPPQDLEGRLEFAVEALAHEAKAVNEVKRSLTFTVVIGNPPYSLMSANLSEEARHLIDAYRFMDGVKIKERGALQLEKNLQDDYVKFIRLAEVTCGRSPMGVMGFITNHAYLDNPTLRGLRRSLESTFSSLWLLDLHGNSKRKERSPIPGEDKNVFEIQQGVAIALLARGHDETDLRIQWGELWGSREAKYLALAEGSFRSLSTIPVSASPELYLFIAQDEELRAEFDRGLPLDGVFSTYSTGIATARDRLAVRFSRAELTDTVAELSAMNPEEARAHFQLGPDTNDWKASLAIADLKRTGPSARNERRYQYRPFDRRYTYYTGQPRGFLCNPRWPVMRHVVAGPNTLLCSVKAVETGHDYAHVFVTSELADHHSVSLKEVNYSFPCLLYPEGDDPRGQKGLFLEAGGEPEPNFTPEFISSIERRVGVTVGGSEEDSISGNDLLSYVYGILHSPNYRKRYGSFLRKEFARIPVPWSAPLFMAVVSAGRELVSLHLVESPVLDHFVTYVGPQSPEVTKVGWSDDSVWLDATSAKKGWPATPGTIGFKGVPEEVWSFHIGGYQVCEKWLKDRYGRTLSKDDIEHYQKIVSALAETIRIMAEIDKVIEEHGGWPDAFAG
jgi:predicted helicase